MPRGLLLLLLVLLIGGYFYFFGGGKAHEGLPSIEMRAVVNEGDNGYIVGAEGKLNLPEEKEYNVVGTVYISVEGVRVKEESVNTVVKGPSELPLNLAGVSVSGEDVRVGAEITVIVDGKEMNFTAESPVTFPPKSARLVLPSVAVSVSSVERVEGGYDATLKVEFYNPNDFDVSVKNAKVKVGANTYPLTVSSIPSNSTASAEALVPADSNTVKGTVEAEVVWGDVKKNLYVSFSVSFPEIPLPEPIYTLDYTVTSVTNSGVTISTTVDVNNPSSLPLTLDSITIRVRKADVVKEVQLATNVSVPPFGEKNFTQSISAIPFLVGGTVELWVKKEGTERKVLESPLELVSTSLVKPVELNVWVEDGNTTDVVHVILKNPNDYNMDVRNFSFVVTDTTGGSVATYSGNTSFEFRTSKELTLSYDKSVVIGGEVYIDVSFDYGISELDLWFPTRFYTDYRVS